MKERIRGHDRRRVAQQRSRLLYGARANRQRPDQDEGIALLVVLIVFTVLMLVVSQLQFTTKLEEVIAEARATDSMGAFAIASVAARVMTLMAEDFRESKVNGLGGGAAGGMAGRGGRGGRETVAVSDEERKLLEESGVLRKLASGQPAAVPANLAGGARTVAAAKETVSGIVGGSGADPGTYDYLMKRFFSPDTHTVSGVSVKAVITDNERRVNLNRLWDYPHVDAETIRERAELDERAGADGTDVEGESSDTDVNPEALLGDVERLAREELEEFGLNATPIPPVDPSDEHREAVREMLERMIELTIDLNEERGFLYDYAVPVATDLAYAIEEYCFYIRSLEAQNAINLVSELLNIDGVSPELFYGPQLQIPRGEEFIDPDGFFAYRRDEYGDLVGESLEVSDEWVMDLEDRRGELEELMSLSDTPFQSFGGLGALGNPLTRNMQEYAEDFDGLGLLVPPQPIGLRDLFCTHSSGKINLNTASAPVIYGLLLSLDEEDGQKVALDIEEYRYRYQEEIPDEEGGIEGADTFGLPDVGQPRRERVDDELDEFGNPIDSSYLSYEDRMTDPTMAGLDNPETNYFTDLRQLILIDGEEGDNYDLLNEGEGVERIDEDFKTPFQLVRDDLQHIVVYGGTFFTATFKMKTQESLVVKEGTLLVHRDVENRRIEVIHWKELER